MTGIGPPPAHADLYRLIAEYTYDWETWVDAHGTASWINPAVERITGYTVEECLAHGDYPLALVFDEDRPLLASVLTDAARGGSGNDVEFRVRRKDGVLRWVAISWQAVRASSGALLGYRTSVRDIEERKRMEAELHVMRHRAEAAVIARTELLANVSHELRSPVHGIAGFAELLRETPLDATQQRYVERIASECASMQRHIEDLLQLAALEAGGVQLERQPFDLKELVCAVVDAARGPAVQRGLTLDASFALACRWVQGDPLRVGQVLRNLLDNALKFTDHGSVEVRVASELCGDEARISIAVQDTGMGMKQDEIERLVEPFQQAASGTARRHGGVGLGLSIVKRLVTAMRGTLRVDSEPDRGTTMHVRLCLQASGPQAGATEPRPPPDHRGERALIVDDSPVARELLRALLERTGYDVSEARSGREAIAQSAHTEFDLVLLDYQMPDLDGAATALALRRAHALRRAAHPLSIYLLTANVFAREQLEQARASFDGILEKPLARATLMGLLGELAERRATHPPRQPVLALPAFLDARVVDDLRAFATSTGETAFARVLEQTRSDIARSLGAARRALASDAWSELARAAHELAGQAALIGAREAAEHARSLENALTLPPPRRASIVRHLARVERAWRRAELALTALRAGGESELDKPRHVRE